MLVRFSDSVPHMTSPAALHKNVMDVLNALSAVLPYGSHVILIGLVDGEFIYQTMADRIHPLGQFHGNIHYDDVYKWFNCMEMGPCSAWMNGNVTLRKFATLVSYMPYYYHTGGKSVHLKLELHVDLPHYISLLNRTGMFNFTFLYFQHRNFTNNCMCCSSY